MYRDPRMRNLHANSNRSVQYFQTRHGSHSVASSPQQSVVFPYVRRKYALGK